LEETVQLDLRSKGEVVDHEKEKKLKGIILSGKKGIISRKKEAGSAWEEMK